MEVRSDVSSARGTVRDPVPPGWSRGVARLVSCVGSPPFLGVAAAIVGAHSVATREAWFWAAIEVFLAVIAPSLYVLWLVCTGRVTDLHVELREERGRPLIAGLVGAAAAWLVLLAGGAPTLLVIVAGTTALQTVLVLGITMRWKISVHSATAAGLAAFACSVVGYSAGPLAIGVPLIAWSRVRLRRHTIAQTMAGALLGTAVILLVLTFAYIP